MYMAQQGCHAADSHVRPLAKQQELLQPPAIIQESW